MPLTPSNRLGPYEIVAPLGSGGMGEVYRARDTRLGRDVAVKLLPADLASRPDLLERFEREARTVAALNHPNIVTLHSIEESGGVRFLSMELVEGQTLAALVTPGGLPLARLLDFSIALADALAAEGFRVVSGGTENHLLLVDLRPVNLTGKEAQVSLDRAGITCNKNTIPFDPETNFVTSGIRLGTAAETTAGMGEDEMRVIAGLIAQILRKPDDRDIASDVKAEARALCEKFPPY